MKLEPPSGTNLSPTSKPPIADDVAITDETKSTAEPEINTPSQATENRQSSIINRQSLRLGALATIWLALVVAAWFAIHRPFSIEVPFVPFSPEIPLAIGGTLATVGLLALMLLASILFGSRLLSIFLKEPSLSVPEQALFGLGLGLGLNSFLMLGFGLLGLLGWPLAYALLILELALNWPLALDYFHGFQSWRNSSTASNLIPQPTRRGASFITLLRFYLGFVALVTLLIALAPPIAWDSQMYHLVGPKLYVEAGQVKSLHDLVYSNYPFGMEMLYTWAILLFNDSLAQCLHWSFGMAGGLAVFVFARRFFGSNPRTPVLAATLYLSIPLVQVLMGWAYTDLAVTFYGFLALYAVMTAFKLEKAQLFRLMILAGVYIGFAFGGKYSGVVSGPGIAAVFLMCALQARMKWPKIFSGLLLFGSGALATALPWLIRNFFFSDNPIAPLIFGVRGWDKAELKFLLDKGGGGVSLSPLDLITIPWSLVIEGVTGQKHDATLSPLFLALAPLIALVLCQDRTRVAGREVALAIGVHYAAWLVTISISPLSDQSRILLPVLPLLALLTAHAIAELPRLKLGLLRPAVSFTLGLYLATNVLSLGLSLLAYDPLPLYAGLKTRDAYLEENIGSYYRVARFINTNLPADAYVHTFFEPRSYYINRRTAPDTDLGQFSYYYSRYPDPVAFNAALKIRGATHILVSERGKRYLLDTPSYGHAATLKQSQPLSDELEAKYWKLLFREPGEYAVYEIK